MDDVEGDTRWRLGHRPALDGLRGVAILFVLAAHTGIPQTGPLGGYGVTVFFTLSGFLITALLLHEHHDTGRISFRRFYIRRARRLVPAFVAFLLLALVLWPFFGDWWLEWGDFPPVLLYVANWWEAQPGTPNLGVLTATWSLSIEEQFYLMWPAVVAVAARHRRWLLFATVWLAGASLVARAMFALDDYDRMYFGSDTNAYALLFGAAVAMLRVGGSPGRTRPWAVLLCGVLVGWAFMWPMKMSVVFGMPFVAAVTAVALWMLSGAGTVRGLDAAWLRWVGSRSYAVYLFHVPVIWALREGAVLTTWWVLSPVSIGMTLLLAEGSYRWVESPFRARRSAPAATGEVETGADAAGVRVSR